MTKATQIAKIEEIAKKHFSVETLESRDCDSLDFYETPVWAIKEALEEAYAAGQAAGAKK